VPGIEEKTKIAVAQAKTGSQYPANCFRGPLLFATAAIAPFFFSGAGSGWGVFFLGRVALGFAFAVISGVKTGPLEDDARAAAYKAAYALLAFRAFPERLIAHLLKCLKFISAARAFVFIGRHAKTSPLRIILQTLQLTCAVVN